MTRPLPVFFLIPGAEVPTVDFGPAPVGATVIDPTSGVPFARKALTADALTALLALHRAWWKGDDGGARANLAGAYLDGANLDGANLDGARDDLYAILDLVPHEVPGLLAALREGRVNGEVYEGSCACLVGTVANVRGCRYTEIPGLTPDSSRPAERWFMLIRPGYTPENHTPTRLTVEWIESWMAAHPQPAGGAS